MSRIIISIFIVLLVNVSSAESLSLANEYRYTVDLVNSMNDKISVSLIPPKTNIPEAIFRFPAFVPGTYEVYNFGRFVSNFKAIDATGNQVPIEKLDINSWKIPDLPVVTKITYDVDDTWDTEMQDDFVFEPGGSNIESGKNFVLNGHCFFGYFDQLKQIPFYINVMKPDNFYGSTALTALTSTTKMESYNVPDYMQLVDSPIMFCVPDTTTLTVGNAKVLVSVYSQNRTNSSTYIAKNIESVLKAQKEFLGGHLPIDKYAFIIYQFDGNTRSGSYGALEHSYSSFYFLPEMQPEDLVQTIRDFAAHEFFHIITPLTIHSEEIGNFEYNNPRMSRHLWMYEGVTEYFAGSVQVKYGLLTQAQYLELLRDKLFGKDDYNDTLAFTRMSLGCLDIYKDQYANVYEKGALIGMCLDIKLRQLSDGKYGIQNLMQDLSKTYGKQKSFKDDELFDEITRLTYPEIRKFINTYIDGNKPLPLKEVFNSVGVDYNELAKVETLSPFGGITPAFNKETARLYIAQESYREINDFGKTIGLNIGDELLKLNGKKLKLSKIEMLLTDYFTKVKEGDYLNLQVLRKDDNGKPKKVKLKVKVVPTLIEQRNVIKYTPSPTENQLSVRKAWLGIAN